MSVQPKTCASRTRKRPLASSCAPSPAANKWRCCKYTNMASPWPSTGPNCHPRRNWSKSCMRLCWRRVSGWWGAGCCWGTWMMSDDYEEQQRHGVPRGGAGWRGVSACQGRRRAGSRAGYLCGGNARCAGVGDWGGWGWAVWQKVEPNIVTTLQE